MRLILKLLNILLYFKYAHSALLYPQFTVMQLIGSISAPITDLSSNRKVFFDWGIQMNYDMPYNISSFYMAPIWSTNGSRNLLLPFSAVHKHDFTAKQLYDGIEDMIERFGYNRSCLKHSICELSHHPFDNAYSNMLTEVIDFVLKPSIHEGFADDEKYEGSAYKLPEVQGVMGKNCQNLHSDCFDSLFDILTVTDVTNN